MTELADRLSRHADLHEHQPWADDEQMQFARDLREAVGLIAELARLRAQVPVGWIGPSGFTHNTATNRMWMRESPKLAAKLSPVYAAPPAQPAEPVQPLQGDPVTLADVLDALNVFNKPRPSEGGEPWTEADFISVKHLPDFINIIAVAWFSRTQPAEPVQRLSDERAAFEAWHNEYRTQELVRRDDTYYNTHVRCRWEGWQARAIESALQPGWRDIETPPGWKLVPICLTPEMREVLLMADRFTVGEVYIMLLAAAPKATK